MFVDLPQELILLTTAAFVLGWVLSLISTKLSARQRALKRDPRDNRIRELEAALRVATTDAERSGEKLEKARQELRDVEESVERRDSVISEQQERLAKTQTDLRESVAKTRELRAELTDRATENVRSEARLREVQTELSVAQASTDMIATGVLDYPTVDEVDEDPELVEPLDASNTAR